MNVIRKEATITNTDDEFPGSFEVVLSTPAKDRDGDELAIEDWKTPLPAHITFDVDHGMSVEKTVGSGVPTIEDDKLVVRGTYSSLQKAQDTRTLVKEGHIRTVSVAFMTIKEQKAGKTVTKRELLNGAFVAIPSNREAVILSAKAGARNSASDTAHIQAIYDHAVALGAGPMDDSGAEEGTTGGKATDDAATKAAENAFQEGEELNESKQFVRMVAAKAIDGSYEQREQALCDALSAMYPGDDMWAYTLATFDDTVVYRVSGSSEMFRGQWRAPYTYDNGVATIGDPERVNLVEQVVPLKSYLTKTTKSTTEETTPPAAEKSADADALGLQHRLLAIKATAATAG